MPWEKSFDLDKATDLAMDVFWAKGYEATSISDLTNGMGINKGSLYNAFGNKKALFTRALLKYDRDNRQYALAQLAQLEDPEEAVTALFDGLIAESLADTDKKGCLLVNTAIDLPNHQPDVQDFVTGALGEFEDFFRETLVRGQKDGKIPESLNSDETAKTLLSLVVALRVLARGVFDVTGLTAIRNQAVNLLRHN